MSNNEIKKCPLNKIDPNNTNNKDIVCGVCSFSKRVDLDIVCGCPESMTAEIYKTLRTEYTIKEEDHSKIGFQEYVERNFTNKN